MTDSITNLADTLRAMREREADYKKDLHDACLQLIGFALPYILDNFKHRPMNDLTLYEAQQLLNLAFEEAKFRNRVKPVNTALFAKWGKEIIGFTAAFETGTNALRIEPAFK